MRLDEFQLAGAQPSPVQRAMPAQASNAPLPQSITNFGSNIKKIVQTVNQLPDSDPIKDNLTKFLELVREAGDVVSSEDVTNETVQTVASTKSKSLSSGATRSTTFIDLSNEAYTNAMIAEYAKINPQGAAEFAEFAQKAANKNIVKNSPEVKKAKTAAIRGITLNARGEIGKLDKDIEAAAHELVERFGVKLIWARNLVGMFGMNISRENRVKFLQACVKGEALDVPRMLNSGGGKIEDYVTRKVPEIKQVFDSVKATLLDISLSTGQRGATGPFEAMLAIMGGAVKPEANEGGDVKFPKFPGSPKFEVKSTSLTPTSKLNSKGELPATGGASEAWLDSMNMQDISGSALRGIANEWLQQSGLRPSQKFMANWKVMDFKSKSLPYMANVATSLDKSSQGTTLKFIKYLMSSVFPATAGTKDYNFDQACQRIVDGIKNQDSRAIAKEQGIMAMIEYCLGKGNDGFILFNSSTQEFKIIKGIKAILTLASSPDQVHFYTPMTMAKKDRASPGIYFGPDPTTPQAKDYFKMYNSDPKRVALRKAAAEAEKLKKSSNTID